MMAVFYFVLVTTIVLLPVTIMLKHIEKSKVSPHREALIKALCTCLVFVVAFLSPYLAPDLEIPSSKGFWLVGIAIAVGNSILVYLSVRIKKRKKPH